MVLLHNLTYFFPKTKEGKWFPLSVTAMELITSKKIVLWLLIPFYPFLNWPVFNFSFKESITKNQLGSHSKRTSLTKFRPFLPDVTFCFFFFQTALPYLNLSCINDCWSMSRHQKKPKRSEIAVWDYGCTHFYTCVNKHLQCINKPLEAVARRGSVKKVFLEISQNSQENTSSLQLY